MAIHDPAASLMSARFMPPWTVDHDNEAFWVEDASGARVCQVFYDDQQGAEHHGLTRAEALRIVTDVAALPDLAPREE